MSTDSASSVTQRIQSDVGMASDAGAELLREARAQLSASQIADARAWFDEVDADGGGTLDEDELSEYLLPRREDSEEGYVDEELRQLMSVLHHGPDRIDYEEDEEEAPPPGGAEARFDVTRLREVGSMVLGAFPMLRDLAEETHGGEL